MCKKICTCLKGFHCGRRKNRPGLVGSKRAIFHKRIMVVSLSAFKGFCDLWLFTSCNLAESAAMISRNVLNILNETGSQENETVCIFAYIFSDLSRFYRAATSPSRAVNDQNFSWAD